MKIAKVIDKIEGEAELSLNFNENNIVDDAIISFGYTRGIEDILVNRAPMDSLVITPRVCGICNHAHLQGAIRALEDGYKDAGVEVNLTTKARAIRDFTLNCELIQNHIKWFYLTIEPILNRLLNRSNRDSNTLKALYMAQITNKASAIFAGQWPHSSYCVVGGVTCDPTYLEILQANRYIDEVIKFYESVVIEVTLDDFLSFNRFEELLKIKGDLGETLYRLGKSGYAKVGKSKDRFIAFANLNSFKSGKSLGTAYSKVDIKHVRELLQSNSASKAVTYKCKFYETGPLARAIINKEPLIMSVRKRYRDSIFSRILARVREIGYLLSRQKELLNTINPSEESCLNLNLKVDNFRGVGVIEAARGSLIHKIEVNSNKIKSYNIITPTQWNLSNSIDSEKGVAIEAIIGSKSQTEAELIFKSFDVCSVCTTK